MKAVLCFHNKIFDRKGNIVEIKLWKVERSRYKPHGYKYSLAYIVGGNRAIGYDNGEGKGDHRHYGDRVKQYKFSGIRKLIGDFNKDVERYLKENP